MYSQQLQASQNQNRQHNLPAHYPVDTTSYNTRYTTNPIIQPLQPPPAYTEPTPSASDSIRTPLSIPELADFSSMMVYLMWHARRPSVLALHDISKNNTNIQTNDYELDHSKETAIIAKRTTAAFKKYCNQILTATQLSESVIILSLKYIAMLLKSNPNIQGAEGSEYRLFTVALMLGNKFLDDNTFTNKTWSMVTGMKVTDLNVMELEFLDVIRFKLFVQREEFERYQRRVLLFRHQLLNADGYLLEEAFSGVIDLQQQTQQQQLQQQEYQHQQLMLILSPQAQTFPTPPLDRITRVPLRIPLQPVWRNSVRSATDYYPTPINTYYPQAYYNNGHR